MLACPDQSPLARADLVANHRPDLGRGQCAIWRDPFPPCGARWREAPDEDLLAVVKRHERVCKPARVRFLASSSARAVLAASTAQGRGASLRSAPFRVTWAARGALPCGRSGGRDGGCGRIKLRPPVRKSQPSVEHAADMVDARRARRVGFRIWAHGRSPSPGPRAALYDGYILPTRPLRPLPLGIRRQSHPDVARRRSRARQHGGRGPAFLSGSGVAVRRRDDRNRDRRSRRDL